ncbi:MAG: YajQ family cyclic di-GMP-binding protein [Gammaproteobacteria bacterium]|nr:YajQ family cyclic di-GMP-binding protein [Gammaproteobacteria bacterium]
MPSLDIKSEIDSHELLNAIDQANRVINNRFDFKGKDAKFILDNEEITLYSQEEFQINQMMPILKESLVKRNIDVKSLDPQKIEVSNFNASQKVLLRQGINRELAKKITALVKKSKLKIQAQIQGEEIRVSGKKRDDLQQIMKIIKDGKFNIPLQFVNFRD